MVVEQLQKNVFRLKYWIVTDRTIIRGKIEPLPQKNKLIVKYV